MSPTPHSLRRRCAALLAVALVLSLLWPQATPVAEAAPLDQEGSWGAVLDWGIQGKHMALLPTGNVLVWSTGDNARVWDVATGAFTQTPALFGDLHCAAQATLADGRVIVIGGQNGATHIGTTVTALFDPFTNTWTQGRPMDFARWYATATTLPDGRVLATSGDDASGNRITTPEVYDPATDSWTRLTGAVRNQGLYPHMFVLPSGQVYEAGTNAATWKLNLAGAGAWTPGPANAFGSSSYAESSAMYAPGKILRSGGADPSISRAATIDMTAAQPQWQELAPMAYPRRRHNLVILADGQVLAIGGTAKADDAAQAILPGEIWNPDSRQWSTVAAMSEARMYHSTALLLPDGRVLTAGGEASGRLHAQIFSPPYLFKGPRPTITAAPDAVAYGGSFTVDTPDADIVSAALLRPDAVTHAFDHNQRYVPLSFSQSAGSLSVAAPTDGAVAPPGYYMLVLKNAAGVPSVARWVLVGASPRQPGAISGRVVDAATGAAIAGATVSYSGGTTSTDADGAYTLADVLAGEHAVTISAAGYAPATQSGLVTAGSTLRLDVTLAQPGSVDGTVVDSATGAPIPGATVSYPGGTALADSAGHFMLPVVAAGAQRLTASATTYAAAEQTVAVAAGGTTTVSLALTRLPTFISGEVHDLATGAPLPGATVTYSGGSAVADALGRFRFDNTAPGTYALTATASGYTALTQQAVVTLGAYATLNFDLVAVAPPPPTSSPIKAISFEHGSLTHAESGADAVGGAIALETAAPLAGAFSAKVAANSTGYLAESFAGASNLYLCMLLKLPASPTAETRIVRVANGSTTAGNLVLRGNGQLRLRNGSTTIGADSPALVPGTVYRVGLHQRSGAGNAVLEAFVAPADGSWSAPFAVTTTGSWSTQATELRVGATNSVVTNVVVDDVRLDGAAMPCAAPAPPTGDTTPPALVGRAPLPNATGVPVDATVTATFGEDVAGVGGASFALSAGGTPIPAAVSYSAATRTATLDPTAALQPNTTYTATLTSSIVDGAGNAFAGASWTFTTAADTPPPPPPAGSAIKTITFENGSLTHLTSGADLAASGVVLESAAPLRGLYSARVDNKTGYLEESFAGTDDLWLSFYVRAGAKPAADARIAMINNGSTTVGSLLLRTTGQLRLRNGSTTIGADSPALVPGTVYRIGLHQRSGSGGAILEAFLATGDAPFGAPFAVTTTGSWATQATRIRLGATNSNAISAVFDEIRLASGAMP